MMTVVHLNGKKEKHTENNKQTNTLKTITPQPQRNNTDIERPFLPD